MAESETAHAPYRTIRELADDDRPREKLLKHGTEVLSDAELIAIILGSGVPGENVLDLARRFLETGGGLPGLLRMDAKALQRTRGLGPAKAAQLAAAVELGRRAGRLSPTERPLLTSPESVVAHIGGRFLGMGHEQLCVLSLDTKGRLLGSVIALEGGVSAIGVRPADVLREPVVLKATSVILVHNHPSGDPRPSPQDVAVTQDLIAAADLLGITLLDHIVIGQNAFVSLKREGLAFHRATSARPAKP